VNLDAAVVLTAYTIVVWHVIKVIVRLVMGPMPRRQCRCETSPWIDGDTADAAECGIDLTRVADDPRDRGAR
jgi:hypothetical protein